MSFRFSRIKKIEDELKRKNVDVIDTDENEKIIRLKMIFSNMISEIKFPGSSRRQLRVEGVKTQKIGNDLPEADLETSFKRLTLEQ